MKEIQIFHVAPSIPEPIRFLETLSQNLWWCWDHDSVKLFRRIDPTGWRDSAHNAVEFLNNVPQSTLEALAEDPAFVKQLGKIKERFDKHVEAALQPKTGAPEPCLAYFSLEYGMHESVRIYSGGLGVLAGDHLKTAADCRIPLVGVGLFYHQGFFEQYLDDDGWQQEHYPEDPISDLPIKRALAPSGEPVSITVPLPEGELSAIVWRLDVGRVPLFLLDTNIPENRDEFRQITARLYGGDKQNRLRQEILLGIGGYRALLGLGFEPEACHLNEGHASFLSLARMEHLVNSRGLDLSTAYEVASRTNVFTTHTPVPAGNETFTIEMLRPHLKALESQTGVSVDQILKWGRAPVHDENDELSMTILGLRLAHRTNGVSELHGHVARGMWKHLWPHHADDEVPIRHVTNGVHVPTWLSSENDALFDRYLGEDWEQNYASPETLEKIKEIPNEEIWHAHEVARSRLIRFARDRMEQQFAMRSATAATLRDVRNVLDQDVLTIGFARRAAQYKRGNLLLSDPERLEKLITDSDRPIQLVFAGKAHPHDDGGKAIIQQIVRAAKNAEHRRRIVFLENYDMRLARFMIQGVDVWLNTPRRNQEASGTSGMKAALNGVLHASILDGWWCEGYANNCGWAIGLGDEFEDPDYQDRLEARTLYNILEDEIIPTFYDRARGGDPTKWVGMMKASMMMALGEFSSRRMVEEYAEDFYKPAVEEYRGLMADQASLARNHVRARRRLEKAWPKVKVGQPCVDRDVASLHVGDIFGVRSSVFLGDLTPDEVDAEICYGPVGARNHIRESRFANMRPVGDPKDGWQPYSCELNCNHTGRQGFTTRVVPRGSNWKNVMPGLITWADGAGSGDSPATMEPVACAINPES